MSYTPDPDNLRVHPERNKRLIRQSLEEVGPFRSIAIDGDGIVRAGNGVYEQAQALGLTIREVEAGPGELIAVKRPDLVGDAARRAAFYDNAGSDTSYFDAELLAAAMRETPRVVEGVLTDEELAGIIGNAGKVDIGGAGDAGEWEPQESGPTRTNVGELWEIGPHRLLVGDCTDPANVARLMGGERADCVFTSPPYAVGVDYGEEYEDTIENLREMLPRLSALWLDVVTPGGFAVVNFGDIAPARNVAGSDEPCEYPMAMEYWPVFRADGWLLWSRRIWCKPNPRVHSPWCIQSNRAATDWEHLWTWRKPGEPIIKRVDGEMRSALGWIDTSLMHGVDVGKEIHGAGMALGIVEWMLNIHSRPGRVVFEPFGGTGTTMIGGHVLGRKVYSCELVPRSADVILRRAELAGLECTRHAPA